MSSAAWKLKHYADRQSCPQKRKDSVTPVRVAALARNPADAGGEHTPPHRPGAPPSRQASEARWSFPHAGGQVRPSLADSKTTIEAIRTAQRSQFPLFVPKQPALAVCGVDYALSDRVASAKTGA
jgi:hypothetical protein